ATRHLSMPLPPVVATEAMPAVTRTSRPQRVLVVEDEVVLRMSTVDMLERLECVGVAAGTGEQALELLDKGGAFDLLLTDLGLPGMSGEELAAEVQQRFPGLPVVIASGYGRSSSQIEGARFISKPYSSIDLKQALDQLARASSAL